MIENWKNITIDELSNNNGKIELKLRSITDLFEEYIGSGNVRIYLKDGSIRFEKI